MDVVEGLLVLIETIFLVGLKALAMKLSDPFGDDVEDLSLITYVNGGWCSSMRMLNAELPGPVDANVPGRKRTAKLGAGSTPQESGMAKFRADLCVSFTRSRFELHDVVAHIYLYIYT